MPPIRTRDAAHLPPTSYAIKVHGVEVGRGDAPAGRLLAIGDHLGTLPGDDVREPVFGLAARWIPLEFRVQAELAGNTVVDRSTLVVTHLAEIVRRRAGRLLSRTDTKSLLDGVKLSDPTVIDDLNAAGVSTAEVQRVLSALLDDGIPIRDLVRVLEAIGDRARSPHHTEALVESVRAALGPAITDSLAVDGRLSAITIAPLTEARLAQHLRLTDTGSHLELLPQEVDELIGQVTAGAEHAARRGGDVALVCNPLLRPALRRLVRPAAPMVAVVSYTELGDHLEIEVIGQVELGAAAPTGQEDRDEYATTA